MTHSSCRSCCACAAVGARARGRLARQHLGNEVHALRACLL